MKRVVTPILLALAWSGTGRAQDDDPPDDLKRILPAVAAEEGSLEIGIITEFSTLNFDYSTLDRRGNEVGFVADDFHSWTSEIQLDIGVIEDLELGVVIPLVYASFEAAEGDSLSERRERNDFGLGDVEIAFSYGFESDDETLLALITLGMELPTNTLDEFFGGTTTAGLGGIEAEKYFGPVGLVAGVETIYEDGAWCHEYQAGIAFLPGDRLFSQVIWAHTPEDGVNRVEATVEYLLSEELSMEWLLSREFSGDKETVAGVGFKVFFGD